MGGASISADARIAEYMRPCLRYGGEIGSGTNNHNLNLGARVSWWVLTRAFAVLDL